MKSTDFSTRTHFPGTTGNGFDVLLHRLVLLERIPALFFALVLLLAAWIPAQANWVYLLILWGFYLLDWALLASLPRFNRSYGPAKPVTLMLVFLRTFFAFLPIPVSIALQIAGTLLVIYAFWIEPHTIHLTHQILRTSKLQPGHSLRVLHLGDLHVERITRRERQLNELVRSLQPDLILFSGDFLNLSYLRDPQTWQAAREVLKEWSAPMGVYAVTGSPAVDLPEVIPTLLKDIPITLLDQERVRLEKDGQAIDLVGLSCTHKPFIDGPRLLSLLPAPSPNLTILLYHSPDLAPEAARAGVDLQLSGHTHGGQIRLPIIGALFTGSLYGKTFEAGRSQIDNLTLYISRGIGLEGAAAPRVRLLCSPEIILWEITSHAS